MFSIAVYCGIFIAFSLPSASAQRISGGSTRGEGMIDGIYNDFVKEGSIANGSIEGSNGLMVPNSLGVKDGTMLLVDVLAMDAGAELLLGAAMEAVGFERTACATYFCSGFLPMSNYPKLKKNAAVRSIRPSSRVTQQAGTIVSEALQSLQVDLIRQNIDPALTGQGLKIGILSDSFDFALSTETSYSDDVSSGDLPPDIDILEPTSFEPKDMTDEGRGMAQLVYDLIPGAEIAFATAFEGQAAFAAAIQQLADDGCDVIVDDIVYFAEPMFQDGIIAQAANSVAENGVPYFSAALNQEKLSWEGSFKGSGQFDPANCEYHDFGDGDIFQSVSVPTGTSIVFQWDDPFFSVGGNGATSDIDMLVFFQGEFLGGDRSIDIGNDPEGQVDFEYDPDFGILEFDFAFTLCEGPPPNLMKWLAFGDVQNIEYDTQSSTSYGHANAEMVAGVGAAFFQDTPAFGQVPPLLQDFSSRGGTPIFFDEFGTRMGTAEVRMQPRFVATNGNINTFFGSFQNNLPNGDGFYFFGTSAAAPNAAAVAILMLQANPDLTSLEIYEILQDTAIDMNTPGFDFDSGFGYIDAFAAVNVALQVSPPVPMGKKGRGGKRGPVDILSMPGGGKRGPVDMLSMPSGGKKG